jgi:hypothetical protein
MRPVPEGRHPSLGTGARDADIARRLTHWRALLRPSGPFVRWITNAAWEEPFHKLGQS